MNFFHAVVYFKTAKNSGLPHQIKINVIQSDAFMKYFFYFNSTQSETEEDKNVLMKQYLKRRFALFIHLLLGKS